IINMNTLILLCGFLAIGLTAQATILWLAARICRLPKRSWARSLASSAVRLFVGVGLWAAVIGREGDPSMTAGLGVAVVVVDAIRAVWLISRPLGGSRRAVFGAWAVQAAAGLGVGFGLVMLMQTCLGMYVMPSSSMSPNIRGYHVVEDLPDG